LTGDWLDAAAPRFVPKMMRPPTPQLQGMRGMAVGEMG
jgi:hypothetical protein